MALAEMTATDPHARLLAYSRESMYRVLETLNVNGSLQPPSELRKPLHLYERKEFSVPRRVVLPQPNARPAALVASDECHQNAPCGTEQPLPTEGEPQAFESSTPPSSTTQKGIKQRRRRAREKARKEAAAAVACAAPASSPYARVEACAPLSQPCGPPRSQLQWPGALPRSQPCGPPRSQLQWPGALPRSQPCAPRSQLQWPGACGFHGCGAPSTAFHGFYAYGA